MGVGGGGGVDVFAKGQCVRDQGLSIIRISSITIYSPN